MATVSSVELISLAIAVEIDCESRRVNQDIPIEKTQIVKGKIEDLAANLSYIRRGDEATRTLALVTTFNFIVLFFRPQDWPGLSFLGVIRFPMIMSIITVLFWVAHFGKTWNRVTKLMIFLLVCEGIRGFLGYALDPGNLIVVNDFWQFHIWKDLCLQFFGLGFPVVVSMYFMRNYELLIRAAIVISFFLAIFALTHSGTGPGGFLGDENDICLVLVMFLPFAVLIPATKSGMIFKLFCLAVALLLCAAIVVTQSRGGFLGFAAVLFLFFLNSDRKLITLTVLGLAFAVALPFVPAKYVEEVRSISTEFSEGSGTIQERLDTWEVAWRVFKDPPNFIVGTGLGNTPFHFGFYEDVGRGKFTKSLAGRAMHSMYFQLLPDLGFYGIIVVGLLLWYTWKGNSQIDSGNKRAISLVLRLMAEKVSKESSTRKHAEYSAYLSYLRKELSTTRVHARAVNISLIGVLTAGVGVSVLYYPPIWWLACMSCALQKYSQQLMTIVEQTDEVLNKQ